MCVVLCRTLETTNSECDLETDYMKFKTVAEAKVALLNIGLGKYAKVTQPKENLCIFFGLFQSVQSDELRVVLCGGNPINLVLQRYCRAAVAKRLFWNKYVILFEPYQQYGDTVQIFV